VAVAERLGVTLEQAEAADGRSESGVWWALSSMAMVPDLAGAGALAYVQAPGEGSFREQTERVLHEIAAGDGGVILGRAGAIVLRDVPGALHVRLDGPADQRAAGVARAGAIPLDQARAQLRDNDAARTGYVRHFYRCDPADARHYHLVIDSTVLPWASIVEMVVTAVRARAGASG